MPVTTTLHAMGVFDEYTPLPLHMLGMHGAAYANFAIQARPASSPLFLVRDMRHTPFASRLGSRLDRRHRLPLR